MLGYGTTIPTLVETRSIPKLLETGVAIPKILETQAIPKILEIPKSLEIWSVNYILLMLGYGTKTLRNPMVV